MLKFRTRKKIIAVAVIVAVLTTSSFVSIKVFAGSNNSKKNTKSATNSTKNVTKPVTSKTDTPIYINQEKATSDNYWDPLQEYIKENPDNFDKNDPTITIDDFRKAYNSSHNTTTVNPPVEKYSIELLNQIQ